MNELTIGEKADQLFDNLITVIVDTVRMFDHIEETVVGYRAPREKLLERLIEALKTEVQP